MADKVQIKIGVNHGRRNLKPKLAVVAEELDEDEIELEKDFVVISLVSKALVLSAS